MPKHLQVNVPGVTTSQRGSASRSNAHSPTGTVPKKNADRISAARAPDQSSQSKIKNRRFYTASRTLLNM